jgi:hypothetical protein
MPELGYAYGAAEKWKEAEELQLRVLRGFTSLLGEEHQGNLECMVKLTWIYHCQEILQEAEALEIQIANAHQE